MDRTRIRWTNVARLLGGLSAGGCAARCRARAGRARPSRSRCLPTSGWRWAVTGGCRVAAQAASREAPRRREASRTSIRARTGGGVNAAFVPDRDRHPRPSRASTPGRRHPLHRPHRRRRRPPRSRPRHHRRRPRPPRRPRRPSPTTRTARTPAPRPARARPHPAAHPEPVRLRALRGTDARRPLPLRHRPPARSGAAA